MIDFRKWRRRASLGLPTVLGLARRGFFIPYRFAADVPTAGEVAAYGALEKEMQRQEGRIGCWLEAIESLAPSLKAIGGQRPPEPRWNQDWFPRTDAAAAYAIVRTIKPALIVEVGCGHSTRFLARAIRDGGIDCDIVAIDPAPRADLEGLETVELILSTAQKVSGRLFERLKPGDVLAIDSSHILMPGTDVDYLLNRILPRLPSGIYLHVHDIFLPDSYPADWDWRGYNEQQGVAPLITSGAWCIEFASHYAVTRMKDRISGSILDRIPMPQGAREASLWLKKL